MLTVITLDALRGIRKSIQGIQLHVPEIVRMAREQRCTWAEIGDALGITRRPRGSASAPTDRVGGYLDELLARRVIISGPMPTASA